MKMSRSRIPIAVSMLLATSSATQSDAPPMPKALRCEFESYSSGTADQTAARITARIKQEPGIDPLMYAALDPAKGTAQFIGNIGAANVTLIATAFTWSLVEVTETGNVNVTQVFLWDEPSADIGSYRAVHSRHSSMMGSIVVSQHYGRCKVLN
jgi:hypothetical protein